MGQPFQVMLLSSTMLLQRFYVVLIFWIGA